MSSEPPEMDIIASGDRRESGGGIFPVCFAVYLCRWQSVLNLLFSSQTEPFFYVQDTAMLHTTYITTNKVITNAQKQNTVSMEKLHDHLFTTMF